MADTSQMPEIPKKILWKPNINRKYGKYFTKTHANLQTED